MPISKSKRKKQIGQRESVGRFGFRRGGFTGFGFTGFGSQVAAFQIAGWAGLFLCLMCISGSTLADGAQKKFSGLGGAAMSDGVRMGDGQSFGVLGVGALGRNVLWEVNRRHALLRYVRTRAGAVRKLHPNEMTLLFGTPSFERADGDLRMWQFASGVCALDVYYRGNKRPVYAEYRVRGSAEHGGRVVKGAGVSHKECAESLFENGGF